MLISVMLINGEQLITGVLCMMVDIGKYASINKQVFVSLCFFGIYDASFQLTAESTESLKHVYAEDPEPLTSNYCSWLPAMQPRISIH